MKAQVSQEIISLLKQKQLEWEQIHMQMLEQLAFSQLSGQAIKFPQGFLRCGELKMYNLMKRRCDLCHQKNGYKLLRTKGMLLDKRQSCTIFILCESCFFTHPSKLRAKIDIKSYMPMHNVIEEMQLGLKELGCGEEKWVLHQLCKSFKSALQQKVNELSDMIKTKLQQSCFGIKQELSFLQQITSFNVKQSIFHVLFEDSKCLCSTNCCYCQYSLSTDKDSRQYCTFVNKKKKQDTFIKLINFFKAFQQIKEKNPQKLFKCIFGELQSEFLKHIESIQNTIDSLNQQTRTMQLRNRQFMAKIQKIYNQKERVHMSNADKLTEQEQYLTQTLNKGIINFLTVDKVTCLPTQLKSLKLQFCPNIDLLSQKLKQLQKLQTITVTNQQIGNLMIQDIKLLNKKNIISEQEDIQLKLLNIPLINKMKQLNFNCKITYFPGITSLFTCFSCLQRINLPFHLGESIENIQQATFVPQYLSILNSHALSPFQLCQNYRQKQMQCLWIGQCREQGPQQQLQQYKKILNTHAENINTIILGNLDGRSRSICLPIYEHISHRIRLKTLILNKIQLQEDLFLAALRQNQILKCISLDQCEGLSQVSFDQICQCKYLNKLALIGIKGVKLNNPVPKLEVFILQRCYDDLKDLQLFLSSTSLTTLSLYQCSLIDINNLNQILKDQVRNPDNLVSLNLGYTKANNKTLAISSQLTHLKRLHIGKTKINLHLFMDQLRRGQLHNLTTIQKLSLKGIIQTDLFSQRKIKQSSFYHNTLFFKILSHFTRLSHLDLSHNQIINQKGLPTMDKLAFLIMTDTQIKNSRKRQGHSSDKCPFRKDHEQSNNVRFIQTSQNIFQGDSEVQKYPIKILY